MTAVLLSPAWGAPYSVYWANNSSNCIGKAYLDGSGVNQSFISGCSEPSAVAVDANYIYWTNSSNGTIGRADLAGSSANQSFITGCSSPYGIAVNSTYIYWSNNDDGTIGRAKLDGTSVNQSFISGCTAVIGIAVNGSYIFWANNGDSTLGRANLDGTGVNQSFITNADPPSGIATDATYIYWSGNNEINRAGLDGTGVTKGLVTGCHFPWGVKVTASYIFWANDAGYNKIGRANLDGGSPNQGFITGCSFPMGLTLSYGATAVTLISFQAVADGEHADVAWETAAEIDTVGFHIWRSESETDSYSRLTDALIPAQGGPDKGARYSYRDDGIIAGRIYYYKLEEIDSTGQGIFHGPVSTQPADETIILLSPTNAAALSRLVPPAFSWRGGHFTKFRIELSVDPAYRRGGLRLPLRNIGDFGISSTVYIPTQEEWRILERLGKGSSPVYWRVVGRNESGDQAVSAPSPFWLEKK